MKIAVYADNTSQLDNARAYFEKWKRRGVLINEDYFLSPADLLSAVEEKNYHAIIVYADEDWTAKECKFKQLKQKEKDSLIIYINGKNWPVQSIRPYLTDSLWFTTWMISVFWNPMTERPV